MKPIYAYFAAAVALSFTIAACVPAPAPTPTPEPVAVPAPAPTPTPAQAVTQPVYENWMDAPQTPGDWTYVDEPGESLGLFGDADPTHLFVLRCNKATRQIGIARRGSTDRDLIMRIRTETEERVMTASKVPDWNLVAAALPATDRLLDAVAISKGRFAVETEGFAPLYIPSWPEVTRVIEDCR